LDIRAAFLAAADHIERHPDQFDFMSCAKPVCGTPGCALGWVGSFLGVEPDPERLFSYPEDVAIACGVSNFAAQFYNRMDKLGDFDWSGNAAECANALRAYADKYHPAEVQA
jgi:hypothetical protein